MRLLSIIVGWVLWWSAAVAFSVELTDIRVGVTEKMPQEVQVIYTFNGPAPAIKDFLLEGSDRRSAGTKIVLDFDNTHLSDKNLEHLDKQNALIESIESLQADMMPQDRLRSVIHIEGEVLYRLMPQADRLIVSIRSLGSTVKERASLQPFRIDDVIFSRGSQGEGRVRVRLSDPLVVGILSQDVHKTVVRFMGATLPDPLERILDVVDFSTPVQTVTTKKILEGGSSGVELSIVTEGEVDVMAYQADREYTIEIRPKSASSVVLLDQEQFTGERISLNFQNIEVRSVLQLLAEFTGLNVVASDAIKGNVTLRLRNVPWDQALSIILKTQGLAKRRSGDILLIGPLDEISAQEKQELEVAQQLRTLVPLYSEFIQINYAKAQDIATLLKGASAGSSGVAANAMLSGRGSVALDVRTNTLLVQETAEKLAEIRTLIEKLDVPVRQVLIEARIVEATDSFNKAIGVRFGGATHNTGPKPTVGVASSLNGSDSIVINGTAPSGLALRDRLNVSLPASITAGAAGTLAMTVGRLPGGTILDLELSALESEALVKVISSPRLVTANQQKASIESGEEIPYLESSSSGAATVAFKNAVLRLEVTPQITPDNRIVLDLAVNQDSVGDPVGTQGQPAINTNKIQTNVLVDDGETIVLGGIYKQTKSDQATRVPYLGKLPGVGWLFRSAAKKQERKELMIFVTPKIVNEEPRSLS